jgi:hypothetical protein
MARSHGTILAPAAEWRQDVEVDPQGTIPADQA